MSEPFTISPATRQGVIPVVGCYGKSGGGKTMSALLLARGLVGPSGRVAIACTENGRGKMFSDAIPGGYQYIRFDAPFTPDRYVDLIDFAEGVCDVLVLDSMSHSWDGDGGVLEMQEEDLQRMAGDDWRKREACKMAAWIKPKKAAKRLVQRILRSRIPVICCCRAMEKTRMSKQNGKTEVSKDEFTTAIMDPNFLFEMVCNIEVFAKDEKAGLARVTKIGPPSLNPVLPKFGEQITVQHGEALARWCANPSGSSTAVSATAVPPAGGSAPSTPAGDPAAKRRDRMFVRFREHGIAEETLKGFAENKGWLAPNDSLMDWPAKRVPETPKEMSDLIVEVQAWKEGALV